MRWYDIYVKRGQNINKKVTRGKNISSRTVDMDENARFYNLWLVRYGWTNGPMDEASYYRVATKNGGINVKVRDKCFERTFCIDI